jgi:hypothetical protein
MANDDDKAASAQCLFRIIRGRRAWHSDAEHGEQTKRDRERCNGASRQSKHGATP